MATERAVSDVWTSSGGDPAPNERARIRSDRRSPQGTSTRMEGYMRKRSVLLLAGALAITASLVIGPAASAKSERTAAGTVVFIHEQEPAILNPFIEEGSLAATSIVVNPVLQNGEIYNDKAVLTPVLFDGKPQIVKANPLTIKFKYKQSAKWSDGSPITGSDFLWTWKTIMNPNWDITSRDGFDQIKSVKVAGKNVTVV